MQTRERSPNLYNTMIGDGKRNNIRINMMSVTACSVPPGTYLPAFTLLAVEICMLATGGTWIDFQFWVFKHGG